MLNNSLYKTIMRDYDRRQAEEKHRQDLRIQEVYDKLPAYEMLEPVSYTHLPAGWCSGRLFFSGCLAF